MELLGEPGPVEAEKVGVGLQEAPGVDGVRQHRVVVALQADQVALADLGGPLRLFEGETLVLARPFEDAPDLALRRAESLLTVVHFGLEPYHKSYQPSAFRPSDAPSSNMDSMSIDDATTARLLEPS